MKKPTIILLAVAGLLPICALAQSAVAPVPPAPPAPAAPASPAAPATPATPSIPAIPPVPPVPPRDRGPKVPVTFLGVETSEVPRVVSEQLGLARGFGLVVDYVVPDGPAAAAGVQPNDILKTLNDQILVDAGQLSKLVRSYPEGTAVTLTVLRKGAETKLTVKLVKRDEPAERDGLFGMGKDWNFNFDNGELKREMERMRRELGSSQSGIIHDAVEGARREVERARDEARKAAQQMRVFSRDDGSMRKTRIDLGRAQIVFSDEKGELRIETVDNKKILTAKDPQGRLLFSGPVENKEDLDKLPPDVRQRYEKLQQNDLKAALPPPEPKPEAGTKKADADDDADDDKDEAAPRDGGAESTKISLDQVMQRSLPRPRSGETYTVL